VKLDVRKWDTEKLLYVHFSDVHLGSKYHDEDLFRYHMDWVLEQHNSGITVVAIDGGDLCETATRDSVGAGPFDQDEIVQQQMERAYEIYKPLAEAGILIGLHRGNHEYRVFKHSGLDITRTLARQLGVAYFGDAVGHLWRVGKESYVLYTCHGTSGAQRLQTKIKACVDLAGVVDAEIYIMGHVHQLSHHTVQYYAVDKRNKVLREQQRHFVIAGCYLKHWGSYAMARAHPPERRGSPKIKLSGTEHRIRVSL
jgi:UDP-2,3-diacylglucosamine pyrophosphatase LpxH